MKNVVIIDDDPMIRNLLKAVLEAEGFRVRSAEDGRSGLEAVGNAAMAKAVDLVILDVIMPGMNGLDVLSQLKAQPDTQDLPVIMLTGEDRAENIIAGYSVGADYYITKPFTRQQLVAGIRQVLENPDEGL